MMRYRGFLFTTVLLVASSLFALTSDELATKMSLNNLEVQKAQQEYRLSLLDTQDAKAGRGPTIDLTVAGTYMVNPPLGPITVSTQNLLQQLSDQGIDVSSLEGYPDAYLKLYDGMENMLYTFSLNITQPIFTWGKISNSIKLYEKISQVRFLQAQVLLRKNKSELLGHESALHYLSLMQDLLTQEAESASRLVEISSSNRDNGMLLDEDVLKVRIQARQVAIALKNVQLQLDNQVLAIQNLCNDTTLTMKDIEYIPDETAMKDLYDRGQDVLVAKATSAMVDNLQILGLLKEVSALTKDISSASVNWKPDFALSSTIGYGGSRFPLIEKDWYRQDAYTLNFTVAIKSTIWDGGKKLRDVTRSQEKEENSEVDYQSAVQSIRNQIITQYLQMELVESKIAYQALVIDSDKKDLQQKQQLLESGYGSEVDQLKSLMQLQADQLSLIQLQLDRVTCYQALSYLSGGI